MFDFLKKLYEQRLKKITVILLDDTRPGKDDTFVFKPTKLFAFLTFVCVLVSIFVALMFMWTPLGALLYSKEDAEMRAQVEYITQRVLALQDSLIVRDYQLSEMKEVIRLSVDTTLAMDDRFSSMFDNDRELEDLFAYRFDEDLSTDKVSTSGIIFSNIIKSAPDFPAKFPVNGTLTRGYEPENEHYGLDIATKEEEIITSIADGTVISATWTISNGYVILVQHAGGLLSVYKHCSSIFKKSGDVILKGDIIGTIGNVGVSSSGPHLHLEIWKDGLPQDPAIYLIQ